jgi:calcineurin-like phosphoesterase family protein
VSVLRLGVIADPHLALERTEDTGWHNPFRLADAHERLDVALAHPLLDDVDVIVMLGDLAHFGDRTSIRYVVDAAANDQRPAILLSGNHDVLTAGVRLEDEVRARGATHVVSPLASTPDAPAVKTFVAAGAGLAVHEVMRMTDRGPQPFDVSGSRLAEIDPAANIDVWLTHFPLVSFEDRCREARLLYSAHLDQLAPPPPVLPAATGPIVVLSGHLHLRAIAAEANVLQLAFAALVEPPYEVAVVDLDVEQASVSYRCASVVPPDAERIPVLDPAAGRWAFDSGTSRWSRHE